MDKNITQINFDIGKNEEYKVEAICDSTVYIKKLKSGHLLEFYYAVS